MLPPIVAVHEPQKLLADVVGAVTRVCIHIPVRVAKHGCSPFGEGAGDFVIADTYHDVQENP